jgi:hypothetical protein
MCVRCLPNVRERVWRACDQPLRSKHCRFCDRCVPKYDHHCMLIGTCIGEKNHCRFWWYLLCETVAIAVGLSVVRRGFWLANRWV